MFKLKGQLSRFGLLIAGLVILTLFTTLGGLWHYQSELISQLSKSQTPGENTGQTPRSTAVASQGLAESSQSIRAGSNQKPGQAGQIALNGTSQGNKTSTATQSTAVATQPTTVSLTLSINGQSKGNVRLAEGSNQCDLLSQALTDGIINSLDMRYSSEYGTEAVYVINGIGDPGSVWWTYTVNGRAPPYGCAYVAAHNGDSVNWQYVKN